MSKRVLRDARKLIIDAGVYMPQQELKNAIKVVRAIDKTLDAKDDEIALKAAAFDELMRVLDGHHSLVRREQIRKPLPPANIGGIVPEKVETELHYVFEWQIRWRTDDHNPKLSELLLEQQREKS